MLEKTYAEVNRLASTMVNWFSPYDYTPYLDEGGNPLAATSISGLADELSDSGSSHTSPRSKQADATSTDAQTELDVATAQADLTPPTTSSAPPAAPTS